MQYTDSLPTAAEIIDGLGRSIVLRHWAFRAAQDIESAEELGCYIAELRAGLIRADRQLDLIEEELAEYDPELQ